MNHRLDEKKQANILFLFSDTGGGHRSATEAIIEAFDELYPGQINSKMVDIFYQYAPPPLNLAPKAYPRMSRMPDVWKFGYRMSDGRRRSSLFTGMFWPYISRSIYQLVKENPSDLIVSVHPLTNSSILRALGKRKVPFITVVTDMVSVHAYWYDKRADLVIVPTQVARQRGIQLGLQPEQLEVVGLPVAARFCQPVGDKLKSRKELGWQKELPVILLVGGGDGMGPVYETATAINDANLPAALVVIAGRNEKLKERLDEYQWQIPITTYGFVKNMPDLMRAADIIVTKAGPGTISEAFLAGLPIVLYSRMPGQEDGNVTHVVSEGAGIWAPEPEMVVNTLRFWLEKPDLYEKAAAASRRLARPDASKRIAQILAERAGIIDPVHM